MRKLLGIITVCIVSVIVLTTGCKQDPAKASQAQIESLTKGMVLPKKLNDSTSLTACYFTDNTLTYRNETSADVLASIKLDSLKQATVRNLQANQQKLVKHLITAKASVRYIYVCGDDSVMFAFTPEQLETPQ